MKKLLTVLDSLLNIPWVLVTDKHPRSFLLDLYLRDQVEIHLDLMRKIKIALQERDAVAAYSDALWNLTYQRDPRLAIQLLRLERDNLQNKIDDQKGARYPGRDRDDQRLLENLSDYISVLRDGLHDRVQPV